MLLVTSICSALVVGIVGYQSGKESLQNAAFNQLTQVRESRTREITSYFDQLKNSMVLYTRGATAIQAVQGFTAGFDALQSADDHPGAEHRADDVLPERLHQGSGRQHREHLGPGGIHPDVTGAEIPAGQLHRSLRQFRRRHQG